LLRLTTGKLRTVGIMVFGGRLKGCP
jgi:hypothetical protein